MRHQWRQSNFCQYSILKSCIFPFSMTGKWPYKFTSSVIMFSCIICLLSSVRPSGTIMPVTSIHQTLGLPPLVSQPHSVSGGMGAGAEVTSPLTSPHHSMAPPGIPPPGAMMARSTGGQTFLRMPGQTGTRPPQDPYLQPVDPYAQVCIEKTINVWSSQIELH